MASDLRLSKHNAKMLKQYTDKVEEMIEEMSLDDDMVNTIPEGFEDIHFSIRHLAEEMNKRTAE